jgi:hypothetical protein
MEEIIAIDFLFDSRDLFPHTLGSGGFDGLDLDIAVSKELQSPEVWAGILNLCARLSFETVSFNGPIVIPKDECSQKCCRLFLDLYEANDGESRFVSLKKTNRHQVHIQSNSAQALGMLLNCLSLNALNGSARVEALPGRKNTGPLSIGEELAGEFNSTGILSNCTINKKKMGKIDLRSTPVKIGGKKEKLPTSFHPLDFSSLYKKDPIVSTFQRLDAILSIKSARISYHTGIALCDAVCAMVLESTAIVLPIAVIHQSSSKNYDGKLCLMIEEIFHDTTSTHKGLSIQFSDPERPVHIKGNAQDFSKHFSAWFDLALNQGGPGFSRAQALRDQVSCFLNSLHAKGKKSTAQNAGLDIIHKFTLESEIETIMAGVSSIKTGQGSISCEAWTSKPMDVRARLKDDIEKILEAKGYKAHVQVLNAFKPGLCRILDQDLPLIQAGKPVKIHIGYRPFDTYDNALELKHRWLHELFPVAEILAAKLSIPEDAVTISMDDTQEEIYRLAAYDENQNLFFEDNFSPFFQTLNYMASTPDLGTVSPTCAGVTIVLQGKMLLDQAILTDRDQFWKQFQAAVIPDLLDAMEARVQSESSNRLQAFFESIQVEVFIDESNYKLGFMDEQISPMEKLHEDIYFFLLKVFEQFAAKHGSPESLKLGQILPKVWSCAGKKGPRAVIQAVPAEKIRFSKNSAVNSDLPFDTFVLTDKNWILSGRLDALTTPFKGKDKCRVDKDRFSLTLDLQQPTSYPADLEHTGERVPEDLVLMAQSVENYLFRLNEMPHIQVWEIAKSLQGRSIYAVEAFKVQGDRVSIPRLRQAKPTVLFNARHHANEISSTTATLKFIEFLGSPQGQSYLETANVVFIPLENVDGVATFESLYVKNSVDILHAARYNALGSEFYNQYFNHPPAFSEAFAKQRLWHRWLPELMADLHGVPNHEWCQPYAGYLPKGFREFWIPRAFVYVHLPFIEDPNHPLYQTAMELLETLRGAISESGEIVAANEKITALYRKYAQEPEPEIFPPADNTVLTALPLLGRARNFNFAVQYPDITCSEVIVEVPDEVAHGKNLIRCVAAHYIIQKALLKSLQTGRRCTVERSAPGKFEHCVYQACGL